MMSLASHPWSIKWEQYLSDGCIISGFDFYLQIVWAGSFWVLFSSVFRGTLERLFSVALLTITGNALD